MTSKSLTTYRLLVPLLPILLLSACTQPPNEPMADINAIVQGFSQYEHWMSVNDINLHYYELDTSKSIGSGKKLTPQQKQRALDTPLVVIHGLGAHAAGWIPFLKTLEAPTHKYALDLPGFGASEKPDANYTIDYLAEAVGGFLDQLSHKKVHLLGHSLGGAVAFETTRARRFKVSRLFLVDAVGVEQGERSWTDQFSSWLFRGIVGLLNSIFEEQPALSRPKLKQMLQYGVVNDEVITPEHVELTYHYLTSPGAMEALKDTANHLKEYRPPEEVDAEWAKRHPTCIIWGKEDALDVSLAYSWSSYLQGSTVEVIEKCGHCPHLEAPKRLKENIEAFVLYYE